MEQQTEMKSKLDALNEQFRKQQELKAQELKNKGKKAQEIEEPEAKVREPKEAKPEVQEAKTQEVKEPEPKVQEAKTQEAKESEQKVQETKTPEAKIQESKDQDSKLQETKTQEWDTQNTDAQESTEIKEKKSLFHFIGKYKFAFLIPVLVLIGIAGFFIWNSRGSDFRSVPAGLPDSEVEKWQNKEVDADRVFISLNTKVSVKEDTMQANLSLMNPPYSAYNFRITIVLEDESGTLVYTSDLVEPGTFDKTVTFQEVPLAGNYDAIVNYTFYGETEDEVVGEHEVPITIEVE